jgi:hypothetical protein
MHVFATLTSMPLDPARTAVVLMIGVAGGFLLGEIRLKPLMRVIKRKPRQTPAGHNGPWG